MLRSITLLTDLFITNFSRFRLMVSVGVRVRIRVSVRVVVGVRAWVYTLHVIQYSMSL